MPYVLLDLLRDVHHLVGGSPADSATTGRSRGSKERNAIGEVGSAGFADALYDYSREQ